MTADTRLLRISREVFVRTLAPSAADALEPWVIDRIVSLLDEVEVRAGDRLFSAGELPEAVFLFREGQVELVREGFAPWVYEGRWVVGGFEVIGDRPHQRTARALTDLQVMKLRGDGWLELIEDSFELARGLLLNMARMVSVLDRRLGAHAEPGVARVLPALRPHPLSLIERLAAITDMTMFRGATVQTLADVAALVEEAVFLGGQTMLEAGAPRDRGFLVLEGEVEAALRGEDVVRRFGPGALAAGAAAFGEHGKDWALRATARTRTLVFPIEAWMDLMEEHFDLLRAALLQLGVERVRILEELGRAEGTVFLR
ncbi:MAG: cyclic nucleotide-binding domain-containing protein [Myxococcota bacterium]|nr:cyclic nucleotide-binding domain-containing protein [Myxococcota bacterium]